jgi:hypothetical protein
VHLFLVVFESQQREDQHGRQTAELDALQSIDLASTLLANPPKAEWSGNERESAKCILIVSLQLLKSGEASQALLNATVALHHQLHILKLLLTGALHCHERIK